jgi:hypothetical protein
MELSLGVNMRISLTLVVTAVLLSAGCDDDEDLLGPDEEVQGFIWESSIPDVLMVDYRTGTLKALRPGTARICKVPIYHHSGGVVSRGIPTCLTYRVTSNLEIVRT